MSAASETIKCAKSLDIKLSADFLQMYVTAKSQAGTIKGSSILQKFTNLFRGSK